MCTLGKVGYKAHVQATYNDVTTHDFNWPVLRLRVLLGYAVEVPPLVNFIPYILPR